MMTKLRTLALLAAIPALFACESQVPDTTVASGTAQKMIRGVIEHDGIEREYFVHVPKGADRPLPVVVAIHGYTSTATGFQAAHNLNPHADLKGYIVVYPQGSHFTVSGEGDTSYRVTSWNDLAANMPAKAEGPHCTDERYEYPCPPECGSCNRCAWTSCYDDLGFIEKMLDAVQSNYVTDTSRYYLLGVSNGGMMALRLGCNLSGRFAAIAPIIAQLAPGYACGPTVDLPMLHLYGGKDNTVRFDGQPGGDGFIYTTAAKTASIWAEAMSCETGPRHWENEYSRSVGLQCTAYSDCRIDGHEVVSCMEPGGGHDWPGQRVRSMPATCVTPEQYESVPGQPRCPASTDETVQAGMDLVWDFFSRYSLQH